MKQVKSFLKENKVRLIVVAVVLAIILAIGFVSLNKYPIATVNGRSISAERFLKNYQGAAKYYDNAQKMLPPGQVASSTPGKLEMQAEVLSQMIEAELISETAQKELGNDLSDLVQNKISRYESNKSLMQASVPVFGMTYEEFREEVMIPQAEKEIMAGRFYMSGDNFDSWLRDIKKSARVNIFSKSFSWDGEKVMPVR